MIDFPITLVTTSRSQTELQDLARTTFAPGAAIRIFFNPNNPHKAVLYPSSATTLEKISLAVLACCGTVGMYTGLFGKRPGLIRGRQG